MSKKESVERVRQKLAVVEEDQWMKKEMLELVMQTTRNSQEEKCYLENIKLL